MKRYSFHGYLITESIHGWHMSKDGFHIYTGRDEQAVRDTVMTLVLMNAEDGEDLGW